MHGVYESAQPHGAAKLYELYSNEQCNVQINMPSHSNAHRTKTEPYASRMHKAQLKCPEDACGLYFSFW